MTTSAADDHCEASRTLTFRRRTVLVWLFAACVAIELAFVILDYTVNYSRGSEHGPIRRMFNITREDSLASWFSIMQTMLTALAAWGVWVIVRHERARWWRRLGWLMLALFFTYMAVDDGATVHERLGTVYKSMNTVQVEAIETDDAEHDPIAPAGREFRSYGWQPLFVPFFAIIGLLMAAFLWFELDTMAQRLFVALALACMAAAVGLDYIEGMKPEDPWNIWTKVEQRYDLHEFTQSQFNTTPYKALIHFSKSLEETIEAFAMTILGVVFLRQLMLNAHNLRLRFR